MGAYYLVYKSNDLEVFSASRTSTKLVPLTVQDKEAGCNKKQGKLKTESQIQEWHYVQLSVMGGGLEMLMLHLLL